MTSCLLSRSFNPDNSSSRESLRSEALAFFLLNPLTYLISLLPKAGRVKKLIDFYSFPWTEEGSRLKINPFKRILIENWTITPSFNLSTHNCL